MATTSVTVTGTLLYGNGTAVASAPVVARRMPDTLLSTALASVDIVSATTNGSGVLSMTLVGSDTVPVPFKITFPDKSFIDVVVNPNDTTLALGTRLISSTPTPREVYVSSGAGGGSSDLGGPATSTDNAISRFDGTGGSTVQNSAAFVDDNGNVYAPNVAGGFATTATAAGTTTLTVASKKVQAFTGTTTQTVVLPVVTTLPQTGFGFEIINLSTGALTVNSSGSNLVQTIPAGARAYVTCILLTGTTAASWASSVFPNTTSAGALTNPILVAPSGTSSTGVMITKMVAFTENATNTIHTGTVPIPAGAWLHNISITQGALWTATSASMDVGDTVDPNGYFDTIDLKGSDLVLGEVLSTSDSTNWGGQEGAYLVAATGQRGPVATNFGSYYAAGSNILGVITVGTPATTAGRTYMSVTYSVGEVLAAVATGP
jgi:hypothetical protein